jgi:hypothetical protein
VIGLVYYAGAGTIAQWTLLVACSGLVVTLAIVSSPRWRSAIAIALVVATAASGVISAYAVPWLWRSDRAVTEERYLGASVADLLAQGAEPTDQRPARVAPPEPGEPENNLDSEYSAAFFTGQPSLYGYVNLRGTESFNFVRGSVAAEAEHAADARVFWSAAGVVIEGATAIPPTAEATAACATDGLCGEHVRTTPLAYPVASELVYRVAVTADVSVSINEAWYEGWSARVCPTSATVDCQTLETRRGELGQIVLAVPRGDWTLDLRYSLPGMTIAWALFWLGIAMGIAVAAVTFWRARTRQRDAASEAE